MADLASPMTWVNGAFVNVLMSGGVWFALSHNPKDILPHFVEKYAIIFAVLLSGAFQIIDRIYIYPFFRSPLRKIPTVTAKRFQDLGVIIERPRGKSALEWLSQMPNEDLIVIRGTGNEPVLFPIGPAAFKDIMNTNVYSWEKPAPIRESLARALGYGIILSEADPHRRQRKALTPAFNVRNIRALYTLMYNKTAFFLDRIEDEAKAQGHVELSAWASKLTLDIIGHAALSRDLKTMSTADDRVAEAFANILEPTLSMALLFGLGFLLPQFIVKALPLASNKLLNEEGALLRSVCAEILSEKKAELREKGSSEETDIMASIITSNQFSDEEIQDQMLTVLFAGHETTASALTWLAYLLALAPEKQEKLRDEIRSNLPPPVDDAEVTVNYTQFESLPYLHGVCEETLRLYPTVPITIREAVVDTTCAGYAIPKGTGAMICPYAINRNPRFWKDADKMVPERWIDVSADGTQRPNKHGGASNNFAEITFLHGQRSCLGRDFAKAELRCAVAGLFGRFRVTMLDPNEKIDIVGTVTTKPKQGMKLKLERLSGW